MNPNTRRIFTVHALMTSLLLTAGAAMAESQPPSAPPATEAEVFAAIRQSHLDGNIPPKAEFEKLLKRDLLAYFSKGRRTAAERNGKIAKASKRPLTVTWEFLRDGPTQSGVSYPKYYLWVTLREGTTVVDEGAVRVAAVDRKRFDVTDYLPKASMRRNPGGIDQVFPLPVGEKIKARLRQPPGSFKRRG